jgi:hypothetical protein
MNIHTLTSKKNYAALKFLRILLKFVFLLAKTLKKIGLVFKILQLFPVMHCTSSVSFSPMFLF